MRQIPSESPLTFIARLQTHEAKMLASVNKQPLSEPQKQAQMQLTESMVLNTLLTGLEPKIAQVVRASNPEDMLTAIARVKKELQLNYFEQQKLNRDNNTNNNMPTPMRKPNVPPPVKQCSFCKRTGHLFSECRQRQQNFQPSNSGNYQNFPRPNYYNQNSGNPQTPQAQRSPVIGPNPNFNSPRPPAIQPNPNYFKPNVNRKTFYLNQRREPETQEQINQNYYFTDTRNTSDGYHTADNTVVNSNHYTVNDSEYDNNNENYYTANGFSENYYVDETFDTTPEYNQDFRPGPQTQSDLPYSRTREPNMTVLQTQFGNMNLDSFDPNLNFPEQRFL
ncbi:hypothetical protein NQ315_014592 [Exocentrus adspersus]|uniref:CCHC-type domain-containing protein n=1 Tax=Exocentrus adspersus TaxID=1586481 RepID=A0AAV8VPL8_9CUCU|nr:hypothetical protein NQ315_014592 [Exocentrus adspersus]